MKPPLKQTHCVWWFETDDFDGKVKRVYQDFYSQDGALLFKAKFNKPCHMDTIANLPWHHSHA